MVEMGATVKNFSAPMKESRRSSAPGASITTADPAFAWMMSNVVAHVDKKDNVFPNKQTSKNKIDGAVALIMAMSFVAPGASSISRIPRIPVSLAIFGMSEFGRRGGGHADDGDGIPAALRAVRLLARTMATLPIGVYERLDDGSRRLAPKHPLHYLLTVRPNRWMTAFGFKEMMAGHVELRGNGYAEIKQTAAVARHRADSAPSGPRHGALRRACFRLR
jgi:hypothetical protein